MPVKYPAKGIIVKAAATVTPTTALTQVRSISLSMGDVNLIDVTTHDSVTTKDYVHPGLRDTVEVDLTIMWDPADAIHELVRLSHATGALLYMTVVLPDAGTAQWACSGYVTGFSPPSLSPDGSLEVTIKYKAKSVDTFTA